MCKTKDHLGLENQKNMASIKMIFVNNIYTFFQFTTCMSFSVDT